MEFSRDAAAAARKRGFDVSEKLYAEWRVEDFGGPARLGHAVSSVGACSRSACHGPRGLESAAARRIDAPCGPDGRQPFPKAGALRTASLAPAPFDRWTKRDFATLAENAGLELRAVVASALDAGTAGYFGQLGERESRILDPAARPRSRFHHLAQKAFWKLVTLDYRLPIPLGHSVFAQLRKPLH